MAAKQKYKAGFVKLQFMTAVASTRRQTYIVAIRLKKRINLIIIVLLRVANCGMVPSQPFSQVTQPHEQNAIWNWRLHRENRMHSHGGIGRLIRRRGWMEGDIVERNGSTDESGGFFGRGGWSLRVDGFFLVVDDRRTHGVNFLLTESGVNRA